MEKICKNCLVRIQSTGKCVLHGRPVADDNTCEYFDPKEEKLVHNDTKLDEQDEILADNDDKLDEQEQILAEDESEDATTKKHGYGKIDYNTLKRMYNEGATFTEMAKHFGKKGKSSIMYHINKLVEKGELEKRMKPTNCVYETCEMCGDENTTSSPYCKTCRDKVKLEHKARYMQKWKVECREITNDDLLFIKDLIEGARQIIIYRENIKVTIDFNHKEAKT